MQVIKSCALLLGDHSIVAEPDVGGCLGLGASQTAAEHSKLSESPALAASCRYYSQ